ncbi:MAG: hypothetical protein ABI947_05970 [Chloroflexota bacterium]
MFERFKDRLPFRYWDPDVLRDYCEYGLLPIVNGEEYVLACPPVIEADLYTGSTDFEANIYPETATIQIPVYVMRSGKILERPRLERPATNLCMSPTAPDLASVSHMGQIFTCLIIHTLFPWNRPLWSLDMCRIFWQLIQHKTKVRVNNQ